MDFFKVAPRLNLKVRSQGMIMPKMAPLSTMVTIVTLSHQTRRGKSYEGNIWHCSFSHPYMTSCLLCPCSFHARLFINIQISLRNETFLLNARVMSFSEPLC